MAGYYTVKQGEHVSGIADQHGFPKYTKIWSDPNNSDLNQQRQNPGVLYPGDSLYIPDPTEQDYPKPTEQRHKFVLDADKLKLLLVFQNIYGDPVKNCPCKLKIGATEYDLTTDGDGMIQQIIPKNAVDATLTLNDQVQVHGQTVPLDREFELKIGYLDPVDTPTGQQARLANLGYYRGPQTPTDTDELESAMEEFQCDNSLTVDGICGPQTQAALLKVHGC